MKYILMGFLAFSMLYLNSCDESQASDQNSLDQGNDSDGFSHKRLGKFILVRHAEKQNGENPDLTEEGHERAQRLSELLKDEKIDAIYSTNFKRTIATARPTSRAKGLEVQTYDATHLRSFAKKLIKQYRGKTVLVVGHTNTTPELTNYFVGSKMKDIDDDDYGNIWYVKVGNLGTGDLQKKRY